MGKVVNKIPVVSQVKSAAQAIAGDTEGARQTQEEFSKQTPIISQARSAVEVMSGDAEAAKRTQEEFYNETVKNTPVVSQAVSAGYAIAGDSEEAKRIQQQFVDSNVRGIQELMSGSWLNTYSKIATSRSLNDRSSWMAAHHSKPLYQMLLPGTHDTATYAFADAALVTNWAQCQQFSVYDQLKGGIRYLDIRVNGEIHDGKIFCSHSFFTVPFEHVINDVSRFIRENPSEVILFAVQADNGGQQLDAAKTMAQSVLSGVFTSSINGDETVGDLAAGKNVVYIEKHKCGSLNVINSWHETQHGNPIKAVTNCQNFARAHTRTEKNLVLLALEATQFSGGSWGETSSTILEIGSLGQGLEELAKYSNYATLNNFLKDSAAVAGSNVINIDFANDEIIEKVVSLN